MNPPQLTGKPIAFYLDKLQDLRLRMLNTLKTWTDGDLERVIKSGNKNFIIRWILHHIHYRKASHIGQINFLKRLYKIQHEK